MEERARLSQLVRERMAEIGMTQSDLADAIGRSQGWIWHLLHKPHRCKPTLHDLRALAQNLRLPESVVYAAAGIGELGPETPRDQLLHALLRLSYPWEVATLLAERLAVPVAAGSRERSG